MKNRLQVSRGSDRLLTLIERIDLRNRSQNELHRQLVKSEMQAAFPFQKQAGQDSNPGDGMSTGDWSGTISLAGRCADARWTERTSARRADIWRNVLVVATVTRNIA